MNLHRKMLVQGFTHLFVVPKSLYGCIDTVECMDNRLNPSFHRALKLGLKVDIENLQSSEKVYEKK